MSYLPRFATDSSAFSSARWRRAASLAAGSLLCASNANAVGFRQPNQDPDGIARGNAFVATADNPSAIYYNPAGITQLEGQQVRVGIYAISTGYDYTSPTGATASADSSVQPIPQLYYVNTLKDYPFSFGLGVYVPFGLSVDWGKDNPFRTITQEGKLIYMNVNPVIAWKVNDKFSIAAGPEIIYAQGEFKQGILVPGDEYKFKGDGIGSSFNAGIRWQPLEQLAFGLTYRYENTMDFEGHAETKPAGVPPGLPPFLAPVYFGRSYAKSTFHFPQSLTAGVSYRPTPKWNFEFNADWTDFDVVNNITVNGPPITAVIPLNYRSSWIYEFGITYKFEKGWYASVGYEWSESSSPDPGFTPLIPDTDLHLGSIGVGHRGKRWDWTLAYHFGYNAGRTVSGSPVSAAGQSADGKYEVLNHAIDLAATFKF
jgi:long-chain fatty acid transport protein